jgi:hypothetical protein
VVHRAHPWLKIACHLILRGSICSLNLCALYSAISALSVPQCFPPWCMARSPLPDPFPQAGHLSNQDPLLAERALHLLVRARRLKSRLMLPAYPSLQRPFIHAPPLASPFSLPSLSVPSPSHVRARRLKNPLMLPGFPSLHHLSLHAPPLASPFSLPSPRVPCPSHVRARRLKNRLMLPYHPSWQRPFIHAPPLASPFSLPSLSVPGTF